MWERGEREIRSRSLPSMLLNFLELRLLKSVFNRCQSCWGDSHGSRLRPRSWRYKKKRRKKERKKENPRQVPVYSYKISVQIVKSVHNSKGRDVALGGINLSARGRLLDPRRVSHCTRSGVLSSSKIGYSFRFSEFEYV